MRFRHLLPVVLAVAFLAAGGCDTSLEFFDEGAGTYSVFGALDANADTQFVRIESLQDSTFAGTEGALNARITSENLDTGETVVWEEGLFDIESVSVRNAFTTADLEPEATYRFIVEPTGEDPEGEDPEGEERVPAVAEVALPEAFPQPEVRGAPDFSGDGVENPATSVLITGVDRLGTVRVDYDAELLIIGPLGQTSIRREQSTAYHLSDTMRVGENLLEVRIPWLEDIIAERQGVSVRRLFSFRVRVASVSEDWPAFAEDNPPGGGPEGQPLPPPNAGTNIEGGTGFLGGAFTRTVDVPISE